MIGVVSSVDAIRKKKNDVKSKRPNVSGQYRMYLYVSIEYGVGRELPRTDKRKLAFHGSSEKPWLVITFYRHGLRFVSSDCIAVKLG